MKKIIYDIGSNNGDDINYYLKIADLVVAVEANPNLCDLIRERFSPDIETGKLIVENIILTSDSNILYADFYIHKFNHVLSQFPYPKNIEEFEKIQLKSKSIVSLIQEYGDPYYIKIDVENYDQVLLRKLFENNIKPPFISAESHSIEIFCLLVALGGYNSFKLVDGETVSQLYKNHKIVTNNGIEFYSFPHHSAGPFGDDVFGEWMTADNFFKVLALLGLGWKDIHATNIKISNPNVIANIQSVMRIVFNNKV